MIKIASTILLAATLAVPVVAQAASSKATDKSSNVDKKMDVKSGTASQGGKASPGTVGAMNNNPEGSSFTASKSAQKKTKLK